MTPIARLIVLAVATVAACAAPASPPRVAACDEDIQTLKFAARTGDGHAQYRLATRYYLSWLNPGLCASGAGAGDAVEAYRWYTLAAELGIEAASRRRDAMAGSMTGAQIVEAERRVADWRGSGGRGAPRPGADGARATD